MALRRAGLDDAEAISRLFRDRIDRWQRMNADGQVDDLPYEDLTVYERWLHGGAWMTLETGAIWLSHLLSGGGDPLVLTDEAGTVTGYAELYHGLEPSPFDEHQHIGCMATAVTAPPETDGDLLEQVIQYSNNRITVACSDYDDDQKAFLEQHGMMPFHTVQRVTVPARIGQGFYRATDHAATDYEQIRSWHMPIGRIESARQQWETLWTIQWQAIPEIIARTTHRLKIVASGQESFVCFQKHLYDPRSADVYCWTPRPLSSQLLVAIQDRAYREGYRNLTMVVSDAVVKLLDTELDAVPYRQQIFRYEA